MSFDVSNKLLAGPTTIFGKMNDLGILNPNVKSMISFSHMKMRWAVFLLTT